MFMIRNEIIAVVLQALFVLFWVWIFIRVKFSSKRRNTLGLPFRIFRLLMIIATFGVLGACTNPDPLAVASGPVFALNGGHWQPAPQDLAGPPVMPK
jgi:hypothetical protein